MTCHATIEVYDLNIEHIVWFCNKKLLPNADRLQQVDDYSIIYISIYVISLLTIIFFF